MKSRATIFYNYIVVLLFTLTACGQSNKSQKWETIPDPIARVSDFENVFTPDELSSLEEALSTYENRTTRQIAIVTIPKEAVDGTHFDSLQVELFNTWGIGQKETNNGILIGLSKGLRKMRITNGYGIEKIMTDEKTLEIIDAYFTPNFKSNNYFQGCNHGLKAITEYLDEIDSWNNSFLDYPALTADTLKRAELKFSNNNFAKEYRTRITEGYLVNPIDFAGHYTMIKWGCGTGCSMGVIVDVLDGTIYELPDREEISNNYCDIDLTLYNLNSRLYITEICDLGKGQNPDYTYFLWNEALKKFEEIKI